jgi:hypothetical protein
MEIRIGQQHRQKKEGVLRIALVGPADYEKIYDLAESLYPSKLCHQRNHISRSLCYTFVKIQGDPYVLS